MNGDFERVNTTSILTSQDPRSNEPNCPERVRARMQKCLNRLGIPLKVLWTPKTDSAKHGEILSGCLLIYDENELDAWATFEHEVYECKFKEVTYAYRTVINGLIDAVEKLAYDRKERFFEFLPRVSEVIREEQARAKPDKK